MQFSAPLDDSHHRSLRWLLSETFEPMNFGADSFLRPEARSLALCDAIVTRPLQASQHFVEFGPRLNFSTAWSTNAVSIWYARRPALASSLTTQSRLRRSCDPHRNVASSRAPLREGALPPHSTQAHRRELAGARRGAVVGRRGGAARPHDGVRLREASRELLA